MTEERCIRFGPNGFELWTHQSSLTHLLALRVRRLNAYLADHRALRRSVTLMATVLALIVLPAIVGAVAMASGGSGASDSSTIDALSWTNIRDKRGVALSDYAFITNNGSVIRPDHTIVSLLLKLECTGYLIIVILAIWLIGYTLSFEWMDAVAGLLTAAAQNFALNIATTEVRALGVCIGGFIVAIALTRGFTSRATTQTLTIMANAVLGVLVLPNPLGETFSSHGLLAQARNLALAVSAGLHGSSGRSTSAMIPALQTELADAFASRPLKMWNFGHSIPDDSPCGIAWSTGIRTGSSDSVKDNLRRCGDLSAVAHADSPSVAQIGTGALLIVTSTLLLALAVYMAAKVVGAALDTVYHAFKIIFALAFGGYIPGPTQTTLIHGIVGGLVAAGKMSAFTLGVSIYTFILIGIFDSARGHEMKASFLASIVVLAALSQARRFSAALDRSNDEITKRIAAMLSHSNGRSEMIPSPSGVSPMMRWTAAMTAMNAFNSSPAAAWMLGRRLGPLNPRSRIRQAAENNTMRLAASGQLLEWHAEQVAVRRILDLRMLEKANDNGGMASDIGRAFAWDALGDHEADYKGKIGAMVRAGVPDSVISRIATVAAVTRATTDSNPFEFRPRVVAQAALSAASENGRRTGPWAGQFRGWAVVTADNFANNTPDPAIGSVTDQRLLNRARNAWKSGVMLDEALAPQEWENASIDTLKNMGKELSVEYRERVRAWAESSEENARRGINDDPEDRRMLAEALHMLDQSRVFENVTDELPNDPWPGSRVGVKPPGSLSEAEPVP
ncbi:hypothetical protein ABZ319_04110 [Nocardia sp. NPDC005978]|uniref:hypothetical protein n=1 Tax=Nocardia sp. NPDC005978 TaxID=3156725 RepID=UPI0033A84073